MTLPASGNTLSLNQIHVEVGGTSGTTVSLNEADVRGLISKGLNASNSISDYFGASSIPPFTADNDTTVGTSANNTAYFYTPYPNSGTAYPFYNPDGSLNVGGQANVHYTTNDDANIDVRYRHIIISGQYAYASIGRSPSGYRMQSPAKVQDASGHEHHHVAVVRDGGDGYGPEAVLTYWEAQSGGALSGSNWGSGTVYNPLLDLQLNGANGMTGYTDSNNHVGLMADDRTGSNLLAANGSPLTYGDIAILSQYGSIISTSNNGLTAGIMYFTTSFN
tara:strand:+ start:2340 stop:3170 length:831 start_codon:yes stop_codon:yes gene_type:complete